MAKKITIISERVHDVGYEAFLMGIAIRLGINKFFTKNEKIGGKQAIEILIVEKEDLFLKKINEEKPKQAIVSEIRVEDYKDFIPDIKNYYRVFIVTQLYKIAKTFENYLKQNKVSL